MTGPADKQVKELIAKLHGIGGADKHAVGLSVVGDKVRMNMSQTVDFLDLTQEQAITLAASLMAMARMVRKS